MLKPTSQRETEILRDVLRYLENEPRVAFATRVNSGGAHVKDRYLEFSRTVSKHWPAEIKSRGPAGKITIDGPVVLDIVGMLTGGRYFEFEVKRPGEKPSLAQEKKMQLVRERGGISAIIECWPDAALALFGQG